MTGEWQLGWSITFFSSFHYISSRGRRHYFSRLPYSFCLTGNSPELFSFADMACNLVSKLCRRSVFTQLVSCRVLFLLVGQFFVCVWQKQPCDSPVLWSRHLSGRAACLSGRRQQQQQGRWWWGAGFTPVTSRRRKSVVIQSLTKKIFLMILWSSWRRLSRR